MKKVLALILTFVIMFSVVAIEGIITFAETEGDFTYEIENGEAKITKCNYNVSGKVTIPKTIGEYPVTSIGSRAFMSCVNITSITIPDSVKSIGEMAFFNCDGLKKIVVPESVVMIDAKAFYECSNVKSITIPNGIQSIEEFTFSECKSLRSIVIPNSVVTIGKSAFQQCSALESIIIPEGTESMGENVFNYCTGLKSVTLPKSLKSIGEYSFGWCSALKNVYYTGSAKDMEKIEFGVNVFYQNDPKWYNDTCPYEHTYTAKCDESCNKCEYVRSASKHSNVSKLKKATTKSNGKTWKKCEVCGNVGSEKTIYKIKTIKLKKTEFTYNGETQKPSFVVKDSKGNTISSEYYTVSGTKSAKKIGKYKVKITFKGNYSGSKTLSYQIVKPTVKKAGVSKLTAAKKSLKVSIKKASGVSGYEIEYSLKKNFKSSKKKTTTKTSYTIKSLKSNKTYYVRVRSYKKIGDKKFYSAWSSVKSKKTK